MTAPRMTDPGRDWHPTPADLAAARDQTISDVITADLRVLFSGINPGLYSAATGHHFARPGNRFWPALHRSGLTSRQLHPSEQEQLLESFRARFDEVKAECLDRESEYSAAWQAAPGHSQDVLQLTADELAALRSRLHDTVAAYRRLDEASRPPDARRVNVTFDLVPWFDPEAER